MRITSTPPYSTPTTTGDVAAALAAAGFPALDRRRITAISKSCRGEFLAALAACATRTEPEEAQSERRQVENICACLSDNTLAVLASIDIHLSHEDLSHIGASRPVRFLSAIDICADQKHARYGEAKAFLLGFAAARAWSRPAIAPEDTRASSSPPSPPPALTDAGTGARSQQPVNASAKKYRSEHVYGSKYALCFNAINGTDGVPGIMIDAAESNGTDYDWSNAIHFWMNIGEVMAAFSCLRKARSSVECKGHGAKHDKALSIDNQGSHYFCKVVAVVAGRATVRAVKIFPDSVTRLAVIFLEQMMLAYPTLPVRDLSRLACETQSNTEK